jgi:hypothetical protein
LAAILGFNSFRISILFVLFFSPAIHYPKKPADTQTHTHPDPIVVYFFLETSVDFAAQLSSAQINPKAKTGLTLFTKHISLSAKRKLLQVFFLFFSSPNHRRELVSFREIHFYDDWSVHKSPKMVKNAMMEQFAG